MVHASVHSSFLKWLPDMQFDFCFSMTGNSKIAHCRGGESGPLSTVVCWRAGCINVEGVAGLEVQMVSSSPLSLLYMTTDSRRSPFWKGVSIQYSLHTGSQKHLFNKIWHNVVLFFSGCIFDDHLLQKFSPQLNQNLVKSIQVAFNEWRWHPHFQYSIEKRNNKKRT